MTLAHWNLVRTAETISHAMRCGMVLLETTEMIMEQSDSPQQYLDGLYGLWDYLDYLAGDLEQAVEAAYEAMKEG